jgi:hypothetical protein
VITTGKEACSYQSAAASKTSRWRETLRYWIVAGFEYAARTTAMREGYVWHPMLPTVVDATQPSLGSKDASMRAANVCSAAAYGAEPQK